MDNLYQEMVFSLDRYNGNSIKESRAAMWRDISEFLQILFNNEYDAKIYDDDRDIIVVQYEHSPRIEEWGAPRCIWVTYDEEESIDFERENNSKNTEEI